MKRPSPALVVALLALFVALGGPAQAKKLLIGSKQIKDGSIRAKDLGPSLVKGLQATADESITSAKLADGSVTAGKVAKDAITGAAVKDGSLGGTDVGTYAGVVKIAFGALPSGCTGGTSESLKAVIAGHDLGEDAIVVTPPSNFPGGASITAHPEGKDKIQVTACGPAAPGGDFNFRYVAIDVS